jgi:hypothetical protein
MLHLLFALSEIIQQTEMIPSVLSDLAFKRIKIRLSFMVKSKLQKKGILAGNYSYKL